MKNIVYASDDNFSFVLAASIKSLCEHNSDFRIFILDSGIKEEHKEVITKAANGRTVSFLRINFDEIAEKIGIKLKSDRDSLAALSRLFISLLLPQDIDKVLYLDCDTLIVGEIDELYNTDISEYVLAGVGDAVNKNHRRVLGLSEYDNYINSGVLLINYRKWLSEDVEEAFAKLIREKKGNVLQSDQGIINSVLNHQIMILPARYNMQTYNYDFSYKEMCLYRKPSIYYSEEEIILEKKNVVIVHFTTCFASLRPWKTYESKHPFYFVWKEYFYEVGGTIIQGKYDFIGKVYRKISKRISLRLFRVLQVWVKPFIY